MTNQKNIEALAAVKLHEKDTGSSAVQIAVLTDRIEQLNVHLGENPKDHSSRRGLMKLVGKRRRLSQYLQKEDSAKYRKTIDLLGLRK